MIRDLHRLNINVYTYQRTSDNLHICRFQLRLIFVLFRNTKHDRIELLIKTTQKPLFGAEINRPFNFAWGQIHLTNRFYLLYMNCVRISQAE